VEQAARRFQPNPMHQAAPLSHLTFGETEALSELMRAQGLVASKRRALGRWSGATEQRSPGQRARAPPGHQGAVRAHRVPHRTADPSPHRGSLTAPRIPHRTACPRSAQSADPDTLILQAEEWSRCSLPPSPPSSRTQAHAASVTARLPDRSQPYPVPPPTCTHCT
jgi:hypothetical protein